MKSWLLHRDTVRENIYSPTLLRFRDQQEIDKVKRMYAPDVLEESNVFASRDSANESSTSDSSSSTEGDENEDSLSSSDSE